MFKLIRKDKKKGFTLVELIVVIAILAVLALILVPAITGYVSKANEQKDEANARAMYSQAMLIWSEKTELNGEAIKTELQTEITDSDINWNEVNITSGEDGLQLTYKDKHTFGTAPTTP